MQVKIDTDNSRWKRVGLPWLPRIRTRAIHVGLVSLGYTIILALNVAIVLAPPQLRLLLAPSTTGATSVAWVLPGSTLWGYGLRAGDEVLALDGRSPPFPFNDWVGRQISIRLSNGSVLDVDANMLVQSHILWPLLLLSPWFLLLGTLVYLRAHNIAVARAAYALFTSSAFALALAPASAADYTVGVIVEWLMVMLFAVYFLLFFLVFPAPRVSRLFRTILLAPPFLVWILSIATVLRPEFFTVGALLRLMILFFYLVCAVGLLIFNLNTRRSGNTHRGLAIIGAGTLVSILPFIGLYLGPVLLDAAPLLVAEHAILPLAFMPTSFAYAILRHKALDVVLIQRWFMHGVIWTSLLTILTGIVSARYSLFTFLPEPVLSFALTIVFSVSGIGLGWLGIQLGHQVDQYIFKDNYNYRAALRKLSRELSSASDFSTLSASLPDTLCRLMNLHFALFLIEGREVSCAYASAGTHLPVPTDELCKLARNVQEGPQILPLGSKSVLMVPLSTHATVVGYLCLGPKVNGEPFRTEDYDLLATLSGQVGAIIHTTQLIATLRGHVQVLDTLNARLQSAQEEERARLSADIHDEPLQTALHLQRQLTALINRDTAIAELVGLSQSVIEQLRHVCTSMRPSVLDDLGLYAALDGLAQEQSERFDVPIMLTIDAEIADCVLPAATEVVLFRAAQEAVTNCVRHARASMIHLQVRYQPAMIQLIVEDDGIGFEVPESFERLVIQGHLGLMGLQERVHRAGGRLLVASTPGVGTVMQIELPLR